MRAYFARSLSLRLLLVFFVTALLLIVLLTTLFTHGMSRQWQRTLRPHLVQYVDYVQDDLGQPPDPARARRLAAALPLDISVHEAGRLIFATDGIGVDGKALDFRPVSLPDRGDAIGERRDRIAVARHRSRGGPVLRIEQDPYTVYYRFKAQHGKRRRDADGLYTALLATLLVLFACYGVIRWQLAPIRRIQHAVKRIGEGDLEQRIEEPGRGDLADLAAAIDDMTRRLQAMLDAKRQLLLALSHELRSPLARARVATELLTDDRQRDRLQQDLAEMAHLIEDLTESERLRTPHATLASESLDFAELVMSEIRPLGLSTRSSSPVPVVGDATRLRVMVRNLVGNALHHGRGGNGMAEVDVSIEQEGDTVVLRVEDQGPGISPEHLDAITEPFHRLDAARSRSSGGIGLGLSLARLIAEAHGGTLRIESDPDNRPGTRVTAELPQ